MRAVVIEVPGGPEVLETRLVPIPKPELGKVLIRIKAFGLNRSEMYTRWGHASEVVHFPRVLGIECVGVVENCPSGKFAAGQQVCAIMGGLGRQFDGGYAEFSLVPEEIVKPFQSALGWDTLGAIPEMFQTANGALDLGLDLQAEDRILVRGGTSSVGVMAAQLAKLKGAYVLATTRNPAKAERILANGADEVVIDDGNISGQIRAKFPDGIDKVLEFVGPKTLRDSLQCVRKRGIVCMAGYLGNQWALDDFAPFVDIPSGVRLTTYSGEASDLSPANLQRFLDQVAAGEVRVNIDRVFRLEDIVEAHAYMEGNRATGKLVVLTGM